MWFDVTIINFVNQAVGVSPWFDDAMEMITRLHIFKMVPMILILWGFWFAKNSPAEQSRVRLDILKGFVGSLLGMMVARLLARGLPYRERPFRAQDLHLNLIQGFDTHYLDKMSSFPSDHATLAFALVTCVYLVNKRWGVFAFFYSIMFIGFPRVYLSFHYPSDIVLGALIGVLFTWLTMRTQLLEKFSQYLFKFEQTHPAMFYLCFFCLCSQMAQMFEDIRSLLTVLNHFLHIKPV